MGPSPVFAGGSPEAGATGFVGIASFEVPSAEASFPLPPPLLLLLLLALPLVLLDADSDAFALAEAVLEMESFPAAGGAAINSSPGWLHRLRQH